MTSNSNKRKLDDDTPIHLEPSLKRHKKEELQTKHDIIPVKFQKEKQEYTKQELNIIQFCRVKLQRWSPNIEQDESSDQQQYFIDLSVFPCLTPTIFTAIVHAQIIFNKSSNNNNNEIMYNKTAKSLLSDNIKINNLPQLLEGCKILLVKEIFNKDIFKHYFDEHSPIPIGTLKQLHNDHKNHEFLASILSAQLPLYNIMNNYSAQKKAYDRYNKIGNTDFPFLGNATPNGEHAMRYAKEQIEFEINRETLRQSPIAHYKPCDDDFEAYHLLYNGGLDWMGDAYESHKIECKYSNRYYEMREYEGCYCIPDSHYEKKDKSLKQNIDYGLCAAFDDMVKYDANVEPFLTVFFTFIDNTFLQRRNYSGANQMKFDQEKEGRYVFDRSCFCFYALAYIAHRILILYLQKHDAVVKFVDSNRGLDIEHIFHLFYQILNHKVSKNSFRNSDQKTILVKRRILDCLKYKNELNNCFQLTNIRFPKSVFAQIPNYVMQPLLLINNFALKLNNSDCKKAMHIILENCMERMDEMNISESLNDIFQQYLGVKINKK